MKKEKQFSFKSSKKSKGGDSSAEDIIRKLKAGQASAKPEVDYRSASLKIHGTVCARCGRDFEGKNLALLTVHHKDGNPHNNPRDGSNWENLCVECHEAEHSKGRLADYVASADDGSANTRSETASDDNDSPKTSLAEMLEKAMKKGKKR